MDIDKIRTILSSELSLKTSNDGINRLASVLVIIYGSEPKILMTKKPKHLKIHAGEIAFPGGKQSDTDSDMLDTALRETREEIDLNVSRDQIVGQLDTVTTLNSKFSIFPFVTILDDIPDLHANNEVEKILQIPMIPFLKTLTEDKDPQHQSIQEMHVLSYQGEIVWGASARILKQTANKLPIS